MQDYIIIAMIAGFGQRSAIAHFKGQGGAAAATGRKKKQSHVKYQL